MGDFNFNVIPLKVDLQRPVRRTAPQVTQNTTVTFEVEVLKAGKPIVLPEDMVYTFVSRTARGESYLTPESGVKVEDNKVRFTLGTAEMAEIGVVQATIQFISQDGRTDSLPFSYVVLSDLTAGAISTAQQETFIELVLTDGRAILGEAEERIQRADEQFTDMSQMKEDLIQLNATTEATRQATEKTKADTDTVRENTEQVRVNTEAVRTATETVRLATDRVRQETEVVRHETDTARQNAEKATSDTVTERQETEKVRLATETVRQNTEAVRVATDKSKTAADQAATNANNKATEAGTQADHAKTQGDYAKEQGDYAKQQGDRTQEIIDNGAVMSINGKTGHVTKMAERVEDKQRDLLGLKRRHMYTHGVDIFRVNGDGDISFTFMVSGNEKVRIRMAKGADPYIRMREAVLMRDGKDVRTLMDGNAHKEFSLMVRKSGTSHTFRPVPEQGVGILTLKSQELLVDGTETAFTTGLASSFREAQLVQSFDIKHPQNAAVLGQLYSVHTLNREKVSVVNSIRWTQDTEIQSGMVNLLPSAFGTKLVDSFGGSRASTATTGTTAIDGYVDGFGFINPAEKNFMVGVTTPSSYQSLRRGEGAGTASLKHGSVQTVEQTVFASQVVSAGTVFVFEGDYFVAKIPNVADLLG